MVWIPLAVVAVVGAVLVLAGVRGRRIDDHPICCACRFDLFGIYPGAQQCPECGSALPPISGAGGRRGSAIRTGNRRPRVRLIAGGAALLLVAVIVGVLAGVIVARGLDTYPYRPLWTLRLEALHGRADSSAAAVGEVIRRLNDGPLPRKHIESLIEHALERQADHELTWDTQWGDLIEAAGQAHSLTAEQWQRYLDQIVVITIIPRTPVRLGDHVPFKIDYECRVGSQTRFSLWLHPGLPSLDGVAGTLERNPEARGTLPDNPVTGALTNSMVMYYAPEIRGGWRLRPPDRGRGTRPLNITWPTAERTGMLEFAVTTDVRLFEGIVPSAGVFNAPEGYASRRMVKSVATVEVVRPEDAPPIRLVHDDVLGQNFKGAINVPGLEVARAGRPTRLRAAVQFPSRPVPIAFEGFVRIEGCEWPLGWTVADASSRTQSLGLWDSVEDFDMRAETATIILRPCADLARDASDFLEIYGDEIILEDVPIMLR